MNKKPQERRRGHDTERNGERASERVLIVHRETREIPEIREGCSNRCGKAPKERRKCCLVPEHGGTGWGGGPPGRCRPVIVTQKHCRPSHGDSGMWGIRGRRGWDCLSAQGPLQAQKHFTHKRATIMQPMQTQMSFT